MSLNKDEAMRHNQSFWQYKYDQSVDPLGGQSDSQGGKAYQANPTLQGFQHSVDVLVVGGGYTGLTAAREVSKDAANTSLMVWRRKP